MTVLTLLLSIKIAITLVFVVLPFGFFDAERIAAWTGLESSVPLARIYTMAIVALLVGYALALRAHLAGEFPRDMLVVGLVSNGGAAAALAVWARGVMRPLGVATFGAIACGLAVVLVLPSVAEVRLW